MATLTLNGPTVKNGVHNMVLRDVLFHSPDARAVSVSAYHLIEIGVREGAYTEWIGEWDQSEQPAEAGTPLPILNDGRQGLRLKSEQTLVVKVTSNGSPSSLLGCRVNFRLALVGGRDGPAAPLVASGSQDVAIRALERQINTGGLSEWDEPVQLQDPEDATYFFPYILDSDGTTVTVVSSNSITTLYSVSLPAGSVSGDRSVRMSVAGIYLNNDGANRDLTITITYDDTTLYADTVSIANSASTRPWSLWFILSGTNEASNAQNLSGWFGLGAAGGATTGYGDLGAANGSPIGGTSAEDASTALTLAVKLTHGTSSANLSASKYRGVTEQL